jgi:hypothetical protein
MGFPYRSPRLARDARFSARDPNTEQAFFDPMLPRLGKPEARPSRGRRTAIMKPTYEELLDTLFDVTQALRNTPRARRPNV